MHSDKVLDPHSPVQEGFWKIALLGSYYYRKARKNPEILKLKEKIKVNAYEAFLEKHLSLGILFTLTIYINFFWFLSWYIYYR